MLFLGLMSGTSLDGIDISLAETDGEFKFLPILDSFLPYKEDFRKSLKEITGLGVESFEIEVELTKLHASFVNSSLAEAGIKASEISALSFPGQTIYHDPAKFIAKQIGSPHLLASLTSIDVISDFRGRDVARGGQGAPLVPVFHKFLAENLEKPVAFLNIGGVANLSYIGSSGDPIAFDTGPGVALINEATFSRYGKAFDEKGEIARGGEPEEGFIKIFKQRDFLKKTYPKSLDAKEFYTILKDLDYLESKDLIATLTKLTAECVLEGLKILPSVPKKIFLCGGGAKNNTLVENLAGFPGTEFLNISSLGQDPDFIESRAFAYMGARFLKNLPSSFPSTTGVSRETLCGVFFPK